MSFDNLSDLFAFLEENIPINLEIIGEEVKQILRDNVQQLWYGRPYTPTHYTRTMEYINSLQCSKVKKVGNAYEVEVYFAIDLIFPHPAENREWSKHESIIDGEDVSAVIPYYIEYGNNSSLFKYEGVHPMEITTNWLEETNYLKNRMLELLKTHGFIISLR